MFIEHIEYIRKQPVHVRKKYAIIYAVSITGVIVIIWFSVLFGDKVARETSTTPVLVPETPAKTNINEKNFFESANTFFDDMNSDTRPVNTNSTVTQPSLESIAPGVLENNAFSTTSSVAATSTIIGQISTTTTATSSSAGFVDGILQEEM